MFIIILSAIVILSLALFIVVVTSFHPKEKEKNETPKKTHSVGCPYVMSRKNGSCPYYKSQRWETYVSHSWDKHKYLCLSQEQMLLKNTLKGDNNYEFQKIHCHGT